ncbi:hypothetical protein JK386_06240 [Nocardioides sp. zg-536]|uniref:Alpha/beta hydrolase n=1 Tax=Nocardioides faecalis TaxID=2803858 RepID=A0A938Y7X9_9ACTN|nr:hypothetical protein [Nocardioides faecalis]MBM9459495.1 hypothetical protein [Nocardioides faecalis]MBS4751736.1 hypothetical protein [Nocardioides faecalis]QVI59405.1 hypothetical protein KG111_03275 [Nocardioides faecalis]
MIRRLSTFLATVCLVATGLIASAPAPARAAAVACTGYSSSTTTCTNTQTVIGGTSYSVDWYQPKATSNGLMLVQHGFSRNCGHLRGTSKAIAEKGLTVLCINADMTAGNPALAATVGDWLTARAITPPNGKPLPTAYVVGGHSAGGHFASAVGARLAANGYPQLKGAVLFDAVAAEGFSANLQAISAGGARRVLQVAARPSVTNLANNSFGALNDLDSGFVGIQLVWSSYFLGAPIGGSCHTDVEGEDTDLVGTAGALCSPSSTQTQRLRDFGSTWARDLATGTTTAAYHCVDDQVLASCGSKVRDLADRSLPLAAPIR